MSIIKEYQVLAGALLIALSIFYYSKQPHYGYISFGPAGVAVFKDGRFNRYCNFKVDSCFFKHDNDFYSDPLHLGEVVNETGREREEYEQIKREALPGLYQ